ncbi:NAD(P)/FAD-dependent oxidoreductase [Rhizobium lusitanum]|uniref:Glycine/D-amino acid oxidase n=1 Tax=Rhizobium lusitanum TaxID=293958 RepID=A0A1C3WDE5_9HYPH|nr:FAD-dependent oxidoreductase [Rhizobium lusitanum]SCB38030.1 Glycine/D-amino acid oxidase [Rhizobium lusitanum]
MRVVVIGAGIVGSSVAYEAAKAGAEVTVLEAGKIAGGASATSFAWTNATGKRPQPYFALNVAGMRAHLDLAREFGHAPWFHQTGSIEWYSNESDWPAQLDNADQMRDWGYGVEWISKSRLAELEPEIDHSAIQNSPIVYYPEEGWVHPVLYAAWLLRAAKEKWDADIRPFTSVKSIDVRNSVAKAVKTVDGSIYEADAIINCTGSWAAHVLDGVPAIPMASNMGILGFTLPIATTLRRQFHMDDLDVRPDGAGRLVIHKISVDSLVTEMQPLDPAGAEASLLLQAVRKVLPAVQPDDMESIRTIVRPIPGDNLTCSGWVPGFEGYYVAITHSGVSIAPHLGKAVAQEVVGGRLHDSLTDFRPDRFLAAKNGMGQRS